MGGRFEHETHHRSQLCEYLRLLGLEPPPLFGLHAEQLPTWSEASAGAFARPASGAVRIRVPKSTAERDLSGLAITGC
jgi:hypothetical protein